MAQSHYIAESADGQARLEPCDRIKSSQIEGVEEFLIPLGHHRPLDLSRRCEFAALDGQLARQQGPLLDRFRPVVVGRLRIPLRRRRELPANQVWVAYLGVTPLLTPAVRAKVTVNAADGQNPFKPRVYPTAECRIVPLSQVATSEGGVGCSNAVQRSKFTHG